MGARRNTYIAETNIYDDPKNPAASKYDTMYPVTTTEAVIDPKTGKTLAEALPEHTHPIPAHTHTAAQAGAEPARTVMTDAEADAGTSTTVRSVTPKVIKRMVDRAAPNTLIHKLTVDAKGCLACWALYTSVGGVYAPLEGWGFTNANLKEIPCKVDIDVNKSELSLYATPEYAGTWTAAAYPHQSGVWLLSAAGKILVLVRK